MATCYSTDPELATSIYDLVGDLEDARKKIREHMRPVK